MPFKSTNTQRATLSCVFGYGWAENTIRRKIYHRLSVSHGSYLGKIGISG
jgi:hypothetical protein